MSIVFFNRINSNPAIKYLEQNFSIFNDGVHNSLLNVSSHFLVTAEKLKIAIAIELPRDDQDKDYQRTLFKSTFDLDKMSADSNGSFFVKAIFRNVFCSFDRPLKFPILAVSSNYIHYQIVLFIFWIRIGHSCGYNQLLSRRKVYSTVCAQHQGSDRR